MKEVYSAQVQPLEPMDPSNEDGGDESNITLHEEHGHTSRATNYLLCQNQPDIHVTVTSSKIKEFVMKEVKTKLNHGLSMSTTEDHLQNTATLLGEKVIPTKWSDVIRFMKTIGYTDPRHYKVCLTQDHSKLLETGDAACNVCSKPATQCIDNYVLGLNFRDWFLTADRCDRLMAHWNDCEQWFGKAVDYDHPGVTELWHGSRFRELSWFWNSDEKFIFPDWCPFCRDIIPASIIEEASGNGEAITCSSCLNTFAAVVREATGDPRNQVIIIHEDGWNSFSTWQSTITITHGCMSKSDRSNADYAQVYSFIPANQMPTDSPHKYDAFLKPLIDELEELFIEGKEVHFSKEIPGVCESNSCSTLRVLPLLVTADSRAHHEIGFTSAGGHRGCRRCKVGGTYVSERRHYYYGSFQKRYWNPCAPRTAVEDCINGKAADNATTVAERKKICKETGVTGESLFYRLYDLCRFDPVKDLTIDAMHAKVLNLIRTEASILLADLGRNSSLHPSERDPSNGGVLDRQSLASALESVEWTPELKDGRVSTFCRDGQRLSHWKAEEFSIFILVAPVLLRNLLSRKCYDCLCLLKDIYDLVYSRRL